MKCRVVRWFVSAIYTVYVEDFMLRDVKYIWQNMNYKNLKRILKENKRIRVFPLVDNPGKAFT